jgi:hypothetical protein
MRLRGELHPKRDATGVWYYDPAEVIRVAAVRGFHGRRTPGEIAAQAFRMFDQGGELKDIVMALQIPPEEARRLFREWQSSLDDPPPAAESAGPRLLDEETGADEAFARAMAQAMGVATIGTPKSHSSAAGEVATPDGGQHAARKSAANSLGVNTGRGDRGDRGTVRTGSVVRFASMADTGDWPLSAVRSTPRNPAASQRLRHHGRAKHHRTRGVRLDPWRGIVDQLRPDDAGYWSPVSPTIPSWSLRGNPRHRRRLWTAESVGAHDLRAPRDRGM